MAPSSVRKSKRKSEAKSQAVHPRDVYSDLLAEAGPSALADRSDERPLKRPRVAGKTSRAAQQTEDTIERITSPPTSPKVSSTHEPPALPDFRAEEGHDSEDGASDLEFEDISLEQQASSTEQSEEHDQDITIAVPTDVRPPKTPRRKPTKIEKSTRILTHKAHLVALLGHCMIANARCNDRAVQKRMRKLVHPSVRSLLTPSDDASQFQRNHSLMNGLQRAVDAFKGEYRVTTSGMRRSMWRDPEECAAMLSAEIAGADFHSLRAAAKSRSGSQDAGAQLFCALLRSVGVTARLVCSLQVLPLSTSQGKQSTPQSQSTVALTIKPGQTHRHHAQYQDTGSSQAGQTSLSRSHNKAISQPRLAYPVLWTEVFDVAYQKWIPVDAVVTHTIRKATKIEPPASYALNQMSYVIAFSADGAAKDVTRRYARSFNAKTRRMRLEACGPDEAQWLRRVMRVFQPAEQASDDAAIEDAELSRREASEGLPSNILDFSGHPVYALERHLKRHEVIYPRKEVGKVNAGTAANPKMEKVFRRQDVHICRTADQWFRLGRTLKPGLQPLKFVPARSRVVRNDAESDGDEAPTTVGLYSLAQTELYIPAPVSRGKVPRNGFGNIDIYVPSMVPPGGSHVRHELAKHAASILQVDAADAVVGFKFANRKGVAVIEGAVIPSRYIEAVNTVIEGLEWEGTLSQCYSRSLLSLRLWKKFLQGSRIRERVAAYGTRTDDQHDSSEKASYNFSINNAAAQSDDPLYTAGQYEESELINLVNTPKSQPTVRSSRKVISDSSSSSDEDGDDSYLVESRRGSFMGAYGTSASTAKDSTRVSNRESTVKETSCHHAGLGGGFLADDEDDHVQITTSIPVENQPPQSSGSAATSLQPLSEDNDLQHALLSSITDAQLDERTSASATPHAVERSPSPTGLNVISSKGRPPIHQPEDKDTDTERGSRLSHDPEDEDAEPDWMVSD